MKRVVKVKQKATFIIFKGLLVTKTYLGPESVPLNNAIFAQLRSLMSVELFFNLLH